jgi:methionyl-tRNA synthetase
MTEINNDTSQSSKPAASEPAGVPQPEQQKKEESPAAIAQAESNIITIDDFAKVELRAATVLEAERIPKADKLLRLQVDLGEEKPRQILAGIAQHYAPEQLVGRKIIVVSNLAPRKLRGLESNGMLLAASIGEEGRPVLATFTEEVPNGARLK